MVKATPEQHKSQNLSQRKALHREYQRWERNFNRKAPAIKKKKKK